MRWTRRTGLEESGRVAATPGGGGEGLRSRVASCRDCFAPRDGTSLGFQGWDRSEEMLLRDVPLLGGSRLLAPAECSLLGDRSQESAVGGRTTNRRTQRHCVPGRDGGGKTTDR